jgi:hypothetical protein
MEVVVVQARKEGATPAVDGHGVVPPVPPDLTASMISFADERDDAGDGDDRLAPAALDLHVREHQRRRRGPRG